MPFLIDTNIPLETLLHQQKSEEVKRFLNYVQPGELFITDLSIHSICIILFSRNDFETFDQFIDDLVIKADIEVISLLKQELKIVKENSQKYSLDFDDSYQYTVRKLPGYKLVSFDADFDKTDLKRRTPTDITIA